MSIKPKIKSAAVCLMLFGGIVFGQTGNLPPAQTIPGISPDQAELHRARENRRREQRQQQAMRALERSKNLGARRSIDDDEKPPTKEELKKIKALVAPEAEDLAKYKDFLESSKTGLFRLFPNLKCQTKNLLRVDGNCENYVPGGNVYSLRTKTHGALAFYFEERGVFDFYDLRLDGDDLITDAFLSQGILVPLGDIPLETVSSETDGMKFLNEFQPEVENKKVKKQFFELAGVVRDGRFLYSKRVKAVENMTYAMRVIAYGTQTKLALQLRRRGNRDVLKFIRVNSDKRVDLIIAFGIIRKVPKTGLSIFWKELKRENAREIVFQKDEKLSDIKNF